MLLSLQLVSFMFAGLSWQQKNPIDSFCRRFGHQTTVIDRKLYIDGGVVNWTPISENPGNFTNTFLLYNDLDVTSAENMPILRTNLSKNGSIPDVSGGVLWPDSINKRFYMFGGEYSSSPPDNFNLLSYDTIYDEWDSFGPPSSQIQQTSWGAGVAVPERGEGYYYGGWQNNATNLGWGSKPAAASGRLVRYNMDKNVFTSSDVLDRVPRAEGVMVFLPASDAGLLVYFGGIQDAYGNGTMAGMPMSNILIYDIASSRWYNQTASGEVPGMRRRFCAGATWAKDRSSYNIYLYGGAGVAPNGVGWDDVYILSLPSFTWIKYFPPTNDLGNPHGWSTCNVIDGAQMIIIGGTFPLHNDCDSASTQGTHSLDLGRQNNESAAWYAYRPGLKTYTVPVDITRKIGGSDQGGATVQSPKSWDNPDLPVYFARRATYANRTPTRAIPDPTAKSTATATPPTRSSALSSGAIAGIAVGSVVAVALIALSTLCIRRHRLRNAHKPLQLNPQVSYIGPHTPFSPTSIQTNYTNETIPRAELAAPLETSAQELATYNIVDPKSPAVSTPTSRPPNQTYYNGTTSPLVAEYPLNASYGSYNSTPSGSPESPRSPQGLPLHELNGFPVGPTGGVEVTSRATGSLGSDEHGGDVRSTLGRTEQRGREYF